MRGVGMPQAMEICGRLNLGALAGLSHRTRLIALAPAIAIRLAENKLNARSPGREPPEELNPLVVQDDMPSLPTLAGADMQGPGIGVEVATLQRRELTEAAAGQQSGSDQIAELALRRVDEAPAFIDRQIPDPGGIGLFEGLDSAPSVIGSDLALAPR